MQQSNNSTTTAKQMINITLRSVVAASFSEDGENKGHQPENENYVNKPHPALGTPA
jgi:hypothetical protein